MLDPDAAAYLDRLRHAPPMNRLGVAAAREAARARKIAPAAPQHLLVTDRHADDMGAPVPVRIYRAPDRAARPAILYMHAGGWMLGDLDHSDALCRILADRSGCVVVSVDYRLAPEYPFPCPLDDCAAALTWMVREAKALGIDPARFAVAGESSGAHLAAALALRCRDEGLPQPALQALSCPALDPAMATPSWSTFDEGYSPPGEQMAWMWRLLLPEPEDEARAYAVPPRARDLTGLPPAIILTAEYDPLRDEAEHYAAQLASSGVAVDYSCQAGLIHAFLNLGGVVPRALPVLHLFAERIGSILRNAPGNGGILSHPQHALGEELSS